MKSKILIVDDIEDNRLLIQDWFEDDFIFEEAENGQKAIELVQVFKPDLVLLDISLPDFNGDEVARRIRALGGEFSELPLIAVTAHTQNEDREKALEAGCSDFLRKPFRAKELSDLLLKYLG